VAPNTPVTIHCDETNTDYQFTLKGNSIARPTVAVCLSLDQSGSMNDPAGTGGATRATVRPADLPDQGERQGAGAQRHQPGGCPSLRAAALCARGGGGPALTPPDRTQADLPARGSLKVNRTVPACRP
jgi:hypothetical protein